MGTDSSRVELVCPHCGERMWIYEDTLYCGVCMDFIYTLDGEILGTLVCDNRVEEKKQ